MTTDKHLSKCSSGYVYVMWNAMQILVKSLSFYGPLQVSRSGKGDPGLSTHVTLRTSKLIPRVHCTLSVRRGCCQCLWRRSELWRAGDVCRWTMRRSTPLDGWLSLACIHWVISAHRQLVVDTADGQYRVAGFWPSADETPATVVTVIIVVVVHYLYITIPCTGGRKYNYGHERGPYDVRRLKWC